MTRVAARCVVVASATAIVAGLGAQVPVPRATIETPVAWVGRGVWVNTDTHVHTRFSDGGHALPDVVAQAQAHGCDAVAITDHASGVTQPAYADALRAVRLQVPGIIVLAGLEWNPPPYGGREHVSVVVPPVPDEGEIIRTFKTRFDDYERTDGPTPPVGEALAWLSDRTAGAPVPPVVTYNHPSRKDQSPQENIDDVIAWRSASDLLIGFEGAPGHQGRDPIGSYEGKVVTVDRWDPAVAVPGDAWDALLQRGVFVHGASAPSDFHNANPASLNDFWPCAFAETWYYVPERSAVGLLRAMRAGTYFGVHGHIAREVMLSVSVGPSSRPATVGETVAAPAGTTVTASVAAVVPERDWRGDANRIDAVEFIAISHEGAKVYTGRVGRAGRISVSQPLVVPDGGLTIRARGRREVADAPDLMFYTNAVRIVVR